jgi:hypothetical protein
VRVWFRPSAGRANYDFGVGLTGGAVSVVVLVVFLCFLVDFFAPSFVTDDSLFVSVDAVFLLSTFGACVGFGAGVADCWAKAARGKARANAVIRDFFIILSLFAAMPHASGLRLQRLRALA